MKISVQQYARGLYEAVSKKSEPEAKAVLKSFVAILGRQRDLNKIDAIISALKDLWDKEHGELAVELISARELAPVAKEIIIDYLKEQTAAKKINLREGIDKSLIGGFVLRYDSLVVDGSLKNSLAELRNEIGN